MQLKQRCSDVIKFELKRWSETLVNYQYQTKIRPCRVVSVTLHLICTFQIIKLKNKRVLALSNQFSYSLYMSLKSVKLHDFKTPVPCISQVLTILNLYSDRT